MTGKCRHVAGPEERLERQSRSGCRASYSFLGGVSASRARMSFTRSDCGTLVSARCTRSLTFQTPVRTPARAGDQGEREAALLGVGQLLADLLRVRIDLDAYATARQQLAGDALVVAQSGRVELHDEHLGRRRLAGEEADASVPPSRR